METVWYVLRQGRPNRPERVLYRGASEQTARRVFNRHRDTMRQGTLRMGETRPEVDGWPPPESQDQSFIAEPMVRTRW